MRLLKSLSILIVFVLSVFQNNNAFASENVKKVKIDDELYINVYEDQRVKPVENAKKLKESQLDKVLMEMGFVKSDINGMGIEFKQELVLNGGKVVQTNQDFAEFSMYNSKSNEYLHFKGKNLDDVGKQAKEKVKKLKEEKDKASGDVVVMGDGETTDGWDKTVSDHNWKGQTYAVYLGKTPNLVEYRYDVYTKFLWEKEPSYKDKDTMGIWWSTKGEKWSDSKYARVYLTGTNGGTHNFTTTYDSGEIYGSDWKFDWYSSPYTITKVDGYGRQEIRIPVSRRGETMNLQGGYLHEHFNVSGGISFGVAGLDFTTSGGDQWRWQESFTLND